MRNTVPSDSDMRDNHNGGAKSSWSGEVVEWLLFNASV